MLNKKEDKTMNKQQMQAVIDAQANEIVKLKELISEISDIDFDTE
jgi:hypothetical protein